MAFSLRVIKRVSERACVKMTKMQNAPPVGYERRLIRDAIKTALEPDIWLQSVAHIIKEIFKIRIFLGTVVTQGRSFINALGSAL